MSKMDRPRSPYQDFGIAKNKAFKMRVINTEWFRFKSADYILAILIRFFVLGAQCLFNE